MLNPALANRGYRIAEQRSWFTFFCLCLSRKYILLMECDQVVLKTATSLKLPPQCAAFH